MWRYLEQDYLRQSPWNYDSQHGCGINSSRIVRDRASKNRHVQTIKTRSGLFKSQKSHVFLRFFATVCDFTGMGPDSGPDSQIHQVLVKPSKNHHVRTNKTQSGLFKSQKSSVFLRSFATVCDFSGLGPDSGLDEDIHQVLLKPSKNHHVRTNKTQSGLSPDCSNHKNHMFC